MAFVLVLAACGNGTGHGSDGAPSVVVTTTTLGDVVSELVGDQIEVIVIMPTNADPHGFRASARDVNQIREAAALVTNGGGFEEGLLDVIAAAEDDGVPVYEALTGVDVLTSGDEDDEFGEDGDDHRGDDDHGSVDPHFFLDPLRMAAAAEGVGEFLADAVSGIDRDRLETAVVGYVAELEALDAEVRDLLEGVEDDRRTLVTNHDSFSYFADRYDFEVIGTVIPAGATTAGASAQQLAALAEIVERAGVPAVFVDNTASSDLADALIGEVSGEVAVVELFTGSLGAPGSGAETYAAMIRTNAERIAAALG